MSLCYNCQTGWDDDELKIDDEGYALCPDCWKEYVEESRGE